MEDASNFLQMVETLGFPIFIAVVLIGGIYFMMKWMMRKLVVMSISMMMMVI